MIDRKQLDSLLQFARATVEEAGAIALRYFRRPHVVDNKAGTRAFDPVTAADREIEDHIRGRISDCYPDHAILGEELGGGMGTGGFTWIIDPIDGTRSFISGSPLWGILLGLMHERKCVLGLMHQPYLGETFCGSPAGAFLYRGGDSRTLATRRIDKLSDAILYTTHPEHFATASGLEAFMRVAGNCRLMRYGGDCYSYCLLAHGQVDLVIESGLNAYDIAPLVPLIEAAGGVISDWRGAGAADGGNIIAAAGPVLHAAALALLTA